jgi:hypothetical protein
MKLAGGVTLVVEHLPSKNRWKISKLYREWGEKEKSRTINQGQVSLLWWYSQPAAHLTQAVLEIPKLRLTRRSYEQRRDSS